MNRLSKLAVACVAAATVSGGLTGCFPLLLGGAVAGGAAVYTDRRTSGIQLEDQSIEVKATSRLYDTFGKRVRISTTSYNRLVLITGEVGNAADRELVGRTVAGIDNVRSIVNEAAIVEAPSAQEQASDAVLTGKVKASLIDSRDIFAQAVKVVTERGVVYLMGRVTEREATRATEIARGVSGVQKVVRVFEVITESELAGLNSAPASK